jgi:DNA-directed RNA polymerase subunit omega
MMLHPSYTDLMNVVNADVEDGEAPVVASRYSIVMATAKRARQIIGGAPALVETKSVRFSKKPLSIAVEELEKGRIRIEADDSDDLPLV